MTITLANQRPAAVPALATIERILFFVTVGLAACLPWLAPRPAMVDLPQHAAQVALWRDLLMGTSPWADLVHINLLTPYLIGYGLMLPLSVVLSVAMAAKLVLTAAFLGFVAGCLALRRAFAGDPRLDWLFLVGFFGFAWKWGFLTFLVAAPLGLLFLVLARRHAEAPRWTSGVVLAACGLVLLFSHGLVFLMACGLGGLLTAWQRRTRPLDRLVEAGAPYAALGLALILFRLATRNAEGAQHYDTWLYGVPVWLRPAASLAFTTGMDWTSAIPALLVLAMLGAPLVLGSKLSRTGGAVLGIGLAAILFALPSYAFQTAFLFQRFAVFLLPFYALAFRPSAGSSARRDGLVAAALACAAWTLIGLAAERAHAFGEESRPFETVLAAAEPGHRALALIYDPASEAADNAQAYMHYAAWYQAEKHGFVDFNFAAFFPQIVRFRPGRRPPITDKLGWAPHAFDGTRMGEASYDYVFVRGTAEDLARLRQTSPCVLTTRGADGPWTLLARGDCREPT